MKTIERFYTICRKCFIASDGKNPGKVNTIWHPKGTLMFYCYKCGEFEAITGLEDEPLPTIDET